jgi:hypothetical protein
MCGPNPWRIKVLKAEFGIDERTLKRWRQWWKEKYPKSAVWRKAKAYHVGINDQELPLSLLVHYGAIYSNRGLCFCKIIMFLKTIGGFLHFQAG